MSSESVLEYFDSAPDDIDAEPPEAPERAPDARAAPDAPDAPDAGASDVSEPTGHPRQALGIVAVMAVAALGVGYSMVTLGRDQPGGPLAAPRPAASAPAAVRPAPVTPSAAISASTAPVTAASGLAAPIFSAPSPWRRLPDATSDTGRINLARAAQIDGHGELSKSALRKAGFRLGGSRSWQSGGAVLLVLDYTFRSSKAAAGYVSAARRARGVDPAFLPRPVAGIPAAGGFDTTSLSGLPTSSVIFSAGRTAFLLALQGQPPAGSTGDVTSLALQQYRQARP